MSKELNESMKMMSHQLENTDNKIEVVRSNQVEILKLKNTITEMKSSLETLINIFEEAEKESAN